MPFDEGTEQVYFVRGIDLGAQLGAERRLAVSVGQERRIREWGAGTSKSD
jgi:hypothetical protein